MRTFCSKCIKVTLPWLDFPGLVSEPHWLWAWEEWVMDLPWERMELWPSGCSVPAPFWPPFAPSPCPSPTWHFFFHFVQWELKSLPHKIKHWEKEGYSYLFSMYLEILCVLVLSIILMAFRVFSARFLSYLSGLLRFLSNSKVESCRYAKTRNNYVNRLKHKLWK